MSNFDAERINNRIRPVFNPITKERQYVSNFAQKERERMTICGLHFSTLLIPNKGHCQIVHLWYSDFGPKFSLTKFENNCLISFLLTIIKLNYYVKVRFSAKQQKVVTKLLVKIIEKIIHELLLFFFIKDSFSLKF